MDRISAFIIPGKQGSIAKCSMQITSMMRDKPAEVIVVSSRTHKFEEDIISRVKYIGRVQVSPALRPTEIMTKVHYCANNDAILFFDGDAEINLSSIAKLFEIYEKNPHAVYCSSLSELGDINGKVCGASIDKNGKAVPNIEQGKVKEILKIECLQIGCILLPKIILEKISQIGPSSCVEDMSKRINDAGYDMYCVTSSTVNYKGLTNLKD